LLLITSFCALTANAQDYLISFAGTGASTTVSTIKVENLMKGTTLTLNGSDILHLTILTGVNSIESRQSSVLKIYPNPANGNTILQVSPPAAGEGIITVLDMTGKSVVQIQSYLDNGLQEFRLSGLKSCLYLISVKGSNYQYSGKLLSNTQEAGIISIEKIGNNQAVDKKTIKTDTKGEQLNTVDMDYSIGDRLKFTGVSGNYSTVKIDIPTQDKTITFNFIACLDGDNNNYSVVEIGTQLWMAENLKTTKYSDDTEIPLINTAGTWSALTETDKAYCWYNDDISNKETYGALYTWAAAMNGAASSNSSPSGVQGVCPTGWHLPSDAEWTTLTTYLGDESVVGGKLKETGTVHWASQNTGATNETGFTALPGGMHYSDGIFYYVGNYGFWFSAMEVSATSAWARYLYHQESNVNRSSNYKRSGFSVRCIKDN
jgi:uncharacterized protein (TIGR02145 family)